MHSVGATRSLRDDYTYNIGLIVINHPYFQLGDHFISLSGVGRIFTLQLELYVSALEKI